MEFDVKNVIKKNLNNINVDDVELIPGMTGVMVTLYDENPYRHVEKTESGLIIGIESDKKYKSHETGEVEENLETIVCGKVISVGPATKYVQVGEDVFFAKYLALTLPFRKKGYYIIDEHNITCRIKKK